MLHHLNLYPGRKQGSTFYRIIDRFLCQSGQATDSIYGGPFKDDPKALQLKHKRVGVRQGCCGRSGGGARPSIGWAWGHWEFLGVI